VPRPAWWPYPERCGNGHEWGPELVLVSWKQCHCAGAQTLHPGPDHLGTLHGRLPGAGVPVGVV